jgi:hypothetical protein
MKLKPLGFRFLFAYLVLYILPFPLNLLPSVGWRIAMLYQRLSDWIVPLVGDRVLRLGHPFLSRPGASTDTAYNYVQLLVFATLALTTALFWTALDRKRRDDERLMAWLRILVRFNLAAVMISYGADKVFAFQMAPPDPETLLRSYGNSSPMTLLWTFMGASAPYQSFTGMAEVLGGVLLTARRTTLLGGLVCAAVLSNVVMFNFCYDLPVKLFSTHLLLMSLFLIVPEARRLLDFFVLNRPSEPIKPFSPFKSSAFDSRAEWARTLLVAAFVVQSFLQIHQTKERRLEAAAKFPLLGAWDVEEFVVDGKARPLDLTDAVRWRRMIFDSRYRAPKLAVQMMNESTRRFDVQLDTQDDELILKTSSAAVDSARFSYRPLDATRLELKGAWDGKTIFARLRRIDEKRFILVSRGFHWINEFPFH